MTCVRRRLLLGLVLLVFPALLAAEEYVFVFHEGPTATVYSADTLDFVASPEVGTGAVQALGVPDRNQIFSLLKIYVIRTNAVVVLQPDPPFQQIAVLPLSAPIALGENSAFLTPDGSKLIVMAGDFLHVFDALDPKNPPADTLLFNNPISGAAATTNSTRVRVITEGESEIRSVNLEFDPPVILPDTIGLPEIPTAIGSSPNGSGLYAASDNSFFEINTIDVELTATIPTELEGPQYIGFDPEAVVDFAFVVAGQRLGALGLNPLDQRGLFNPGGSIVDAASPGGGFVYLIRAGNGEIRRARFTAGGLPRVNDPETGNAFTLPAIDVEAATRRRRVYFAFGEAGLVVALSHDGQTKLAEVIPAMPTTGISVLEDFGPFPSKLQIYGGNEQSADVDERLPRPIAVRLLSFDDRPLFRHTVTFGSADDAVVTPESVLTNMFGVAEATVVAPNLAQFTVTAGASTELSATFSLNAGGDGLDGLSKVSGDYQYVVSGEPLEQALVVRAILDREPQSGLDLDVTAPPSAVCPATVETDGDGIAIIECTAPTVLSPAPFEIGVSDSSGRSLPEDFQLVVVPTEEDLPQVLFIDSIRPIVGTAGSIIEAGITGRVWAPEGKQVPFLGVTLTTPGDVIFDPPVAVTNTVSRFESRVLLGCTPGSGIITASVNAPGDLVKSIPYTTLVGPAASIEKTRGDLQTGASGDVLNGPGQSLLAEIKDDCGNPLRSEPVEWEVSPPGGATFVNVFKTTNAAGEMYAVVKLGNVIGPVMLTATAAGLSTTFNLTVTGVGNQMNIASGDGLRVAIGQPGIQPLTVAIEDVEGTAVVGAHVDFVVTQGAVQLSSPSAQTNAEGRASVSVVLGSALGPATVEARSGNLTVVFNLQVVGRTPAVSNIGFVNAASYLVGFVPGSTGSIFGIGLMEGVNGVVGADTFPFPLEIQGVKVFIDGVQCPLISISNVNGTEQINLQVPFEVAAPSDATIVTIDNNGAVAVFPGVQTFRVQPGFFEIPQNGKRIVAALHLDYTLVSDQNPARPGEVILLFLTGLGPLVEAVGTNVPGNGQPTVENPVVMIDGIEQQVLGAFYAPGLISGYQVNMIIGPGAAVGDRLLQMIAGGVASQQAIILVGAPLP
ncbi:MAG TPA: hypothetical protein VML01_13160 [Bryobacterales bacterium]|nr:hypothetical protein [Bryobacterales bacterium]